MMTLSFSPATVFGHSRMPFLHGMPSAEVGPVSGRLTPIVTSAAAAPAPRARARAAARRVNGFMVVSVVADERRRRSSAAQGLDVFGNRHGAQAVGIVGVAAHEGARLAALADQRLAARHPMQ